MCVCVYLYTLNLLSGGLSPSRRRILPSPGYKTKKKLTRYLSTFSSYGPLIGTTSRKIESSFVYRTRNRCPRLERSFSVPSLLYRSPRKNREDTSGGSLVMGPFSNRLQGKRPRDNFLEVSR